MDDEDIRDAIDMEREYTKEVSFDYLENLGIKRCVRARSRYKNLTDILAKIKIFVTINKIGRLLSLSLICIVT